MSAVLATTSIPVSEGDGIMQSIVDDFVNDYSVHKNHAKVVKQVVIAVKDKMKDKAPANIKKVSDTVLVNNKLVNIGVDSEGISGVEV
jgi:hypothetical protein